MKNLKKLFALSLVLALLGAIVPQFALAAAVGSSNHPDSVQARDGNGNPLALPDVGYKVFEVMRTTAGTILKDEFGNTPTFGTVIGVWLESGATYLSPASSLSTQWSLLFDTTALTVNQDTIGYRLAPPLNRVTGAIWYALNAQFTRGLVILNSDTGSGAWIYWRPNGGRR